MTATDLLEEIQTGRLSAREAVASCLARLHEVNDRTDAVLFFEDERALDDADRVAAAFASGAAVGPLHGLPVTVKDWIDVEGFPCAGVTGDLQRRPLTDATVVSRLRAAGAVIVAKSRPSSTGPLVRHPLDPTLNPGGSSSGEAALVAAGASPLGIGSDSGGSIRLPAAWCGVMGLKPTAGLVPGTGHFPAYGALSDGRTQIGPIARSVDDLELALRVIAGPDFRDAGVAPVPLQPSNSVTLEGRRFAVVLEEGPWSASAESALALEALSRELEEAGLVRREWPLPWFVPAMDITVRYWDRSDLTGQQVDEHLEDWDRFRNSYLEAAERIDFLLSPATPGPVPPPRRLSREDYAFTLPASLTGSPAMTVPVGSDSMGRPMSVQIMGRPWEDHAVLAVSRLAEAALLG